jgi:hypothetical protein
VLATKDRFVLLRHDLTVETTLPPVFADPLVRMNDGGCDPEGAFTAEPWHTPRLQERGPCTASMPTAPSR